MFRVRLERELRVEAERAALRQRTSSSELTCDSCHREFTEGSTQQRISPPWKLRQPDASNCGARRHHRGGTA
jgi:cytochrome c